MRRPLSKTSMSMKTGKKKKYFFNVTGLVLVALWVVMIGLLVKKVHFRNKTAMGGISQVL